MIIIITGKSGSGKTFLANKIAPHINASVISFDEISHKMLNNNDVKIKINKFFGSEVFDENANLIRKTLGQIVFNDPVKLNILNNIVQEKMEEYIDSIIDKNKNYIFDYALLPEMKYFSTADCKILVKADINERQARIISRDKISNEYFSLRENNSLDYDEKLYDIVINNDKNLDFIQLINKIKEILCLEKQ